MSGFASLETTFFRALNAAVEPLVRAGCASPGVAPTGLIVLETTGRQTGRWHRTPLFASLVGDHVLVGTGRGDRSHWIKNARANPSVRYWTCGHVREATALVLTAGEWQADAQRLPPPVRWLAAKLYPAARSLGMAFAVLVPGASDAAPRAVAQQRAKR